MASRAESVDQEDPVAIRRTLMKADAGVKLLQVETVSPRSVVTDTHYRLSTLRMNQPRMLADQQLALAAFDAEVAASKNDPTAMRLAAAGH